MGYYHLFAVVVKLVFWMYGTFVFILDSGFLSQIDGKKNKVTGQIASSKCLLHIQAVNSSTSNMVQRLQPLAYILLVCLKFFFFNRFAKNKHLDLSWLSYECVQLITDVIWWERIQVSEEEKSLLAEWQCKIYLQGWRFQLAFGYDGQDMRKYRQTGLKLGEVWQEAVICSYFIWTKIKYHCGPFMSLFK